MVPGALREPSVPTTVIPSQPAMGASTSDDEHSRCSNARSELDFAVAELTEHYQIFLTKFGDFVQVHDCLEIAIRDAGNEAGDVRMSAQVFEGTLKESMRLLEAKRRSLRNTWIGKLESFLTRLYPMARLALCLTGAVSEVNSIPSSL